MTVGSLCHTGSMDCIVMHEIEQCYVMSRIVWYCIVLHDIVWNIVWYFMVLNCIDTIEVFLSD